MLGFGLPFPAQGPLPLHPHTPATGLPTRPADPQLGVAVPGTPDPVIPLVPMRAMAELRKLQRGSPSLGLGCFLNLGCDQAQATRAPNTRGRTPKSWRQDCTLSPGPRRPFRRSRACTTHKAACGHAGAPYTLRSQPSTAEGPGDHTGPLGAAEPAPPSPPGTQAADTLAPLGQFISWSEKEKQGRVPVFQPGPDRRGEGWHRGQLRLCMLGPTGVLAGSGEGLPGMVAPSLGAEVAGQRAQRTAHMEAINTDRPGMPLQAGGPRWDK